MSPSLSSMLTRTDLWRESAATRCVLLTLVSLADGRGIVRGAEAWLAAIANVPEVMCRHAVERLSGTDIDGAPWLTVVPGGWQLKVDRVYPELG